MGNEFIKVAFPALNKRSNLEENDNAIREESHVENCKIMRRLEVSNSVFNRMGNELLDDVNDSLYGRIGGSVSEDERLDGYTINEIMFHEDLKKIFIDTMYTPVVEVINKDTDKRFYVNTGGYTYARYVGRAAF